jgi:hypothetical protein
MADQIDQFLTMTDAERKRWLDERLFEVKGWDGPQVIDDPHDPDGWLAGCRSHPW